eukprot:m.119147 g.119147  ORF g.119147 m.119147 type:complete len:151 (-) comp28720_c1_seq5:2388-2840(-)
MAEFNSGATTTEEERVEAAKLRSATGTNTGESDSLFDALPVVKIDVGKFKYVLFEVRSGDQVKHLVRGVLGAEYHMDAARLTAEMLQAANIKYTVLGGGRIKHDPVGKVITIFGHSYGFPWQGQCQHDISAKLCESTHPGYTVTWSEEGY